MDDNNQNLSVLTRRRLLGGIGVIGLASAGAGLGTTAFFSDEEAVSAQVEAGRLDLLMDFRSEYYPWENLYADVYPRAPDQLFDTDGDGVVEDNGDDELGPVYVMGQSPDLRYAADNGDNDAGDVLSGEDWAAASRQIRACSDPFGDSEVVVVTRQDGSTFGVAVDGGTSFGNNLPDASPASDTFYPDYVDGDEGVLFNLDDVKPKDAGEATLSLHLCDNDAYLWTQPFIRANEENGVVEPEGDDTDATGELADYLWVSLWYDTNCNNEKDGGTEGNVDVMIVLDRSGSMASEANKFQSAKDGAKLLVDSLGSSANVGLVSYAGTASLDEPLTASRTDVKNTIDGLTSSGTTAIGDAIQEAENELTGPNARAGARKIMVVLTNGSNNTGSDPVVQASEAKGLGIDIYGIAYGSGANENTIEDISSPPKVDDGVITSDDEFAFLASDIGDVGAVFSQIAQEISGEICIYEGSLAGLAADLAAINSATGSFPLDGAAEENFVINDPAEVSCFPGNSTHCIGFEWYLPCDLDEMRNLGSSYTVSGGGTAGSMFDELVDRNVIASDGSDFDINVLQTDTVEFGATFAAVQCRHNMGNMDPFPEQLA